MNIVDEVARNIQIWFEYEAWDLVVSEAEKKIILLTCGKIILIELKY